MRILVIGETCKDIFIYGEVKRLSPEAPVPIFNPVTKHENDGMAGNVIENLRALDKTATVVGKHQLKYIEKTRYVEKKSNHMFMRIDQGEEDIEQLNINISTTNLVKNSDIIIVSDYDKGFLSHEAILEIGLLSKLSILDSKKKLTKDIIDSFTFVKLNEHEFEKNKDLHECKNIITTLGSRGALYDGQIYPSPTPKETIDVSGAGDTFTSAFILEYYRTNNVPKSIIFANEMASIVVSKRGVATP